MKVRSNFKQLSLSPPGWLMLNSRYHHQFLLGVVHALANHNKSRCAYSIRDLINHPPCTLFTSSWNTDAFLFFRAFRLLWMPSNAFGYTEYDEISHLIKHQTCMRWEVNVSSSLAIWRDSYVTLTSFEIGLPGPWEGPSNRRPCPCAWRRDASCTWASPCARRRSPGSRCAGQRQTPKTCGAHDGLSSTRTSRSEKGRKKKGKQR